MIPEPCTDWGGSSYLIGAATGMIASWLIILFVTVLRKEDK